MLLELIRARLGQGTPTVRIGDGTPRLPERFRGRPALDPTRCPDGCARCVEACPTGAIATDPLRIDLGKCLFCPACVEACPEGAVRFTSDHRLAARTRAYLVMTGDEAKLATALDGAARRLFGRSLRLRQVSAGGCSGCEAELVALGNVIFDLGRFGVQFVASPRHADGIVITGPVTHNMRQALLDTYAAVPAPRLVIAVGACAASGGPFAGAHAQENGVPAELPVDLYVPGCPPHPLTVLDGILRLLGRLPREVSSRSPR
jgi:Ni,Fe-hydrogenase III small subunit/NAD-dependent dihydropyrimidine dehydrogenase PreA subunit